MAAQHPARASPELRTAPLSPRYRRNYTTPWGATLWTSAKDGKGMNVAINPGFGNRCRAGPNKAGIAMG